MDPIDTFHDHIALFSLNMVAHMARILDQNGLLDEETRALIHHTLPLLANAASQVPDDDTSSEMVDVLVGILPPGRPLP